jgi:predicted ribosome-associated RNA-binding protein Tma20
MVFPQYRKHLSGKNFYKITDPSHFTEIQLIGSKKIILKIKANTYFETLRIQEMLSESNCYLLADEKEIESLING